MRKIILVGLAAIAVSYAIGETSETSRTLREIEAKTERMEANPSPEYEHYPNPPRDAGDAESISYGQPGG